MNAVELFETWAPREITWSRWAKPILFAELGSLGIPGSPPDDIARLEVSRDDDVAIVVDLPGAESVKAGLALAMEGFRPIPLFNAACGHRPGAFSSALVDMIPVCHWLVWGADRLANTHIPSQARPAFLLDSRRQAAGLPPMPGRFDNRSLVFPQDFPSAAFLRDHGIQRVMLIRHGHDQPAEDLAHILCRWQEAGIALISFDPKASVPPEPLTVARPSRFKSLFYRFVALAGFHRNSAGGFGSIIPQPSSG